MTLVEIRLVLARTPAVLNALLAGMPERWVTANEGPETFSPFDVLGHLVAGEATDWIPRARRLLEFGESRTFDPFDRFEMYEASRGKTMDQLLAEFAEARASNLAELDALNLTEEMLQHRGMHPELGSVTLGQMLSTWALHDISHVTQITRTMSKQFGPDVGPWTQYFSVFRV